MLCLICLPGVSWWLGALPRGAMGCLQFVIVVFPDHTHLLFLLDTLAVMYVTCNMFLMHCFDFSKSNNDFSYQKVHFLKTKIIKTAEKEPY